MLLASESFTDGGPIPARCGLAVPSDPGPVSLSENRSPHLRWAEVPAGTRSFVITCIDRDCPSAPDDVNQSDRLVPADLPRVDFVHWLLADVPADTTEFHEGEHSVEVTPHGKPADGARVGVHGMNDYTMWFADDPDMAGTWCGYDGPAPPWNESILHRYTFTVSALDVESLGLEPGFARDALDAAMEGRVLASASIMGTYATNPDLE
ncbi:MAG: YbhB/YbcL family Raf kinase inhibitor-like protein [Acidimicrobiia bacterium]|nr:YbhB/YbcL family Raf kinase inhibitor-like protein [Acidimicrobiia bacterium]